MVNNYIELVDGGQITTYNYNLRGHQLIDLV